jgi:hypothetical protein
MQVTECWYLTFVLYTVGGVFSAVISQDEFLVWILDANFSPSPSHVLFAVIDLFPAIPHRTAWDVPPSREILRTSRAEARDR